MKKIFSFALMFAVLAMFTACNNTQDNKAEAPTPESIEKTRSMSATKKIAAEAYYYNSLATFTKGEIQKNMKLEDLGGDFEGKAVNLVVLYDTEAPWADVFNSGDVSKTGDDAFNELLGMYNLAIVKQFELDEMNEGLVLEPNASIDDPVEAAREISMIDYVMMVHVKEVPAEVTETADND
jgi:hypothetical protein